MRLYWSCSWSNHAYVFWIIVPQMMPVRPGLNLLPNAMEMPDYTDGVKLGSHVLRFILCYGGHLINFYAWENDKFLCFACLKTWLHRHPWGPNFISVPHTSGMLGRMFGVVSLLLFSGNCPIYPPWSTMFNQVYQSRRLPLSVVFHQLPSIPMHVMRFPVVCSVFVCWTQDWFCSLHDHVQKDRRS